MKKMLDSKFLFILGLSIIVLIGLGIGTFYLFDNSDNTFIKSGYVINPLSSKVEKYFFSEEVSYHENLSSMIEFKDIDNNNVTILKDSFLHYNDGSISFLKNGAILDLDSINGKDAVSFYNITSESIIEKANDIYVIKTNTNDINFKNFMGRINDDKYIVAGNLELKIPGNNTAIKGDYFEIVYTENGVVNIENREVKYQVTAEGTYIYAEGIEIDLGNKKIAKNKEDIMSITAITIDGDENIEIIPKAKEEELNTDNGGNSSTNDNGNGNNQNSGNGNGGSSIIENNEGIVNKEDTLSVTLENAKVSSTDITVKFDMQNAVITDNFSLRITNLETGRTVEKYDSIQSNKSYTVSFLSPNTKYLFTVVNESDNSKYIQKILETKNLGISIEKSYATESKLGYLITVDKDSEITSAKLILKKFNEETGKTETVKEKYYVKDDEGNDIVQERDRIIELRDINGETKTYEKFFTDLDSDSIYTAVLSGFSIPPYNLESEYELAVTAMTLKKLPDFGNLTWTKDRTDSSFKFAITDIVDEDNAIRSYTYLVYQYKNTTSDQNLDDNNSDNKTLVPAIPAIVKNNASPIEIKVGNGEKELKLGTKYYYKVIIEYFDNEKILEYITTDSDGYFEMEQDPLVTIVPDDSNTSYNRIYGTIYLIDNSCLLNSNSSDECSITRNAIVQIINDPTGDSDDETTIVSTKTITFTPGDDGKLQATLDVGGLEAGTYYLIRVKANRTDMPNNGAVKIEYSDESARGISTKSLSTFYVEWTKKESSHEHVVNVTSKFVADNIGEMTKEESALAIKRVEISLYEGSLSTEIIENGEILPITAPIVKLNTTNFNIKNAFYDDSYIISTDDTFGMDFDTLASLSTNGKIQEYYTVYIRAYYDESGTKPIELSKKSYQYRVNDALLRSELGEMKIVASPIRQETNGPHTNLNSPDTIVGYTVTASWEINKLLAAHFEPKKIRIYVYDKNNQQVSFYLEGEDSPRREVYENIGTSSYYVTEIYMDYGKEIADNIMRRGNEYYIGFEIEAMSTDDNEGRISNLPINESGIPKNYGKFTIVSAEKEKPTLTMYIAKSTASSVKYNYEIDDPDNALYRENTQSDYGLYYNVDGIETILPITDDKDETSTHNVFSGNVTIPNLNQGDYYAIYLKTKDKDNNAVKYPNITDDTLRLFEGEYKTTDYNFKFTVINNELTDNQVKIKILAEDEIVERIINYKVTFTTKNSNNEIDKTKEISFGRLSPCETESLEQNRCLIVDYQTLKDAGMKSTASSIKMITVHVEAMYDNGLTGYDYTVGNGDNYDYKYMIMQGNNTKLAAGNYLSFTKGTMNQTTGKITYNLTIWDEADNIHKGYYRYSFKDDRTIYYTSYYAKLLSPSASTQKEIPAFTVGMDGRKVIINGKEIVLNPKMLVEEEMDYENNTFSFSSCTPAIQISNEVPMINGEILTLTLSGADYEEFCEENETSECINENRNGTYKLYIDVWDNLENIGNADKIVRPTIEITLNNEQLNEPITNVIIDKLKDSTQYYFRVYAWLNKNNVKNYTQLFDKAVSESTQEFKTKNYQFTTWGSDNIFSGITIKSVLSDAEDANYGDRLINTEIKLTAYTNQSLKFNYDIAYAVCDVSATIEECNANSESPLKLLSNTISANKLKTLNNDQIEIDKNFEHAKDYKVYTYAIYEYYDNYIETKSASTSQKEILIGGGNRTLNRLNKPTLNKVEREAFYIDGEYIIEITVTPEDIDEILTDGNYFIKLLSGDTVVGDMQVKTNGVYTTVGTNGNYTDYAFSVEDINNKTNPVRIKGLSENTKYSIIIYSTANLNNYDENIPISERIIPIETEPIFIYTTDEQGTAFGEVNFSANENSIIATLLGGSNVKNVKKVIYTIGAWSNYDDDNQRFFDENATYSGNYTIEERGFTKDDEGYLIYTISPEGMNNGNTANYKVIFDFELDVIDSITGLPKKVRFIGDAKYTK